MSAKRFAYQVKHGARVGLASLVMLQMSWRTDGGQRASKRTDAASQKQARTPIQHVIVIVGEKPHVRPHLRDVPAEERGECGQSVVEEDCQRRRNAGSEFRVCAAVCRGRDGQRDFPVGAEEEDAVFDAARPAERRADGRLQRQRDLLAGRCDVVGKRAGTRLLHLPDERGTGLSERCRTRGLTE